MKPAAYHQRWEQHYDAAIARAINNSDGRLRHRLEHERDLTRRRQRQAKRKEARR